jgi:hypothetical protein
MHTIDHLLNALSILVLEHRLRILVGLRLKPKLSIQADPNKAGKLPRSSVCLLERFHVLEKDFLQTRFGGQTCRIPGRSALSEIPRNDRRCANYCGLDQGGGSQ